VYSGLDELMGFGVFYPNDLEAGLYTRTLNPNEVTEAHLSANAREQRTTCAKTARFHLLRERLTSLVPADYGHDKAFVFSRLTALFHSCQRSWSSGFIDAL